MSENNYSAMMIKSAVGVSDDINAILLPGIYIIPPANTSSPDPTGGALTVHTGNPIRRTFTSDAVIALTSTRNGNAWTAWRGPLSRTHPGADIKEDGTAAVAEFLSNLGLDVALSTKQPLSDTLTKLAALGPQTDADQVLFFSGKDIPAVSALTLAARHLLSKASISDMLKYLELDTALAAKQALNQNLTALSVLTGMPDGLSFFTDEGVMALTALTQNGREILSKMSVQETLRYLTLGDGTGRLLGAQAFSTSGTYVKSPGVKKIIVEAVGGGGASGNLSATDSGNAGVSAAGSPGSYAKAFYDQNIPATVAVTIGSGGVAGTGSGGSGGDGGQSSFGNLVVCPGGKGSQQSQQIPPFSGGSASEAPQPTGNGILYHSVSRSPSCAVLGLGTEQVIGLESTISTALGVYGKGGVGKFNPASSSSASGNNGAQGYILIWEYQ